MNNNLLEKYAQLVVKTGINIQQKQTLVISSPLECAPFARMIAETAYKAGAREVVMNWKDELSAKIKFLQAPDEIFDEFPEWQKEFYLFYARQGAAFISIAASDPELLKEVNPERVVRVQKASNTALKEYRERMMSNKNAWSVVSIPTQAWAQKVFPRMADEEAVEKLWEAILKSVRVDTADPVAAWKEHSRQLKARLDYLNSYKFRLLHYKNSLGTDLKVELPAGHLWLGGPEYTADGTEFVANMPTEEVFTLPQKTGVNGVVVSSKPLNYNGTLIDKFSLTFKDGRIVDSKAEQGQEVLKKLVETDEGSHYLGEVALVPFDSPISNSNILFYNTLFDENASCHLALGKAYPICIENGTTMTGEQLAQAGVNDSMVHVDFMLGTADLEITGTTAAGENVLVFKNGNFAVQ
ncbi:aminopeptidase [Sporomusa acidovorans]|uniref:Aminopeptidase 2 n=1 Tax=Sporomusa acidovorans (strain ATCC 49682 / DSM 3132 / Mol) TaxID=1123286 RepID=A0ABZ3J7T3_SPOA4|nr:aminopeptidase [Sporomusa acidovorans]OZC16665.1 aminopeptidase 2 [Sporomusa acidovorans DSM 3132]SDE06937.1 aminopeptidase II. Metallo peptidase. MEROPS family M29 [Sporomusa acidovorans]